MRTLPDSYRWTRNGEEWNLYHNYGWVAAVRPGEVKIAWMGREVIGPCRNVDTARRYVERWLWAREHRGQTFPRRPRGGA